MLNVNQALDLYFLETRCMLLEIAATLDRIDAAAQRQGDDQPPDDPRLGKIRQSLDLLADRNTMRNRAERLLNLFSDLD